MAQQDAAMPPADYRIVKTQAIRNTITPKKEGLLVYVQDDDKFYKMLADLSSWEEFPNITAMTQHSDYITSPLTIELNKQYLIWNKLTNDSIITVNGMLVLL